MSEKAVILQVKDLNIAFGKVHSTAHQVVFSLNFELKQGKTLAIVGESGSGKSVSSLSFMQLLQANSNHTEGEVLFTHGSETVNLLELTTTEMQAIRGKQIAMIFQEPMAALNPVVKCGPQVAEILKTHQPNLSTQDAKNEALELFTNVELPRVDSIYSSYPHEISGGQQQRVMIAMALANKPSLLIADEPTTALDPSVQQNIIELLKKLQLTYNIAVLFISHDLDAVKLIADDILVMQQGKMVEFGPAKEVFNNPKHAYTRGLLNCKPKKSLKGKWLPTVSDYLANPNFEALTHHKPQYEQKQVVLSAQHLGLSYKQGGFLNQRKDIVALEELSFELHKGETLGIVGPSGCGKSTTGRILAGWVQPTKGEVSYYGLPVINSVLKANKSWARKVQLIFQDPFSSLNPQLTVGAAIAEPMLIHKLVGSTKQSRDKAEQLLEKVGLKKEYFDRYPHEFSGGQRQRIVIARALAVQPEVLVCDESVAALDVSVQAQVLNLLSSLQDEFGLSYLFISHDHEVINYFCDRVLVMEMGKLKEEYSNNNPNLSKTTAPEKANKKLSDFLKTNQATNE